MKIKVFVWKNNGQETHMACKMIKEIERQADITIEHKIEDLSCFEFKGEPTGPIITFGEMAYSQLPASAAMMTWKLPELSKLKNIPEYKENRTKAFKEIKKIAKKLKLLAHKMEEIVEKHVELKDKTTVGIGIGDIQLSQSEIDNLLKIKKLLNGGTIVLTKGDIRIEVKE